MFKLTCTTLVVAVSIALLAPVAWSDDWPQWRGPHRDGVCHETGLIDTFEGDFERFQKQTQIPLPQKFDGLPGIPPAAGDRQRERFQPAG